MSAAAADTTEEALYLPVQQQTQQQQYAANPDPRSMFGDLPNSSLDRTLLGDPIQRELDLRSAAKKSTTVVVHGSSANNRNDSSALSETRRVRVNTAATGATSSVEISADDAVFWKEECRRLQRRLSSVDDERDNMREQYRTQLLAENSDRARDLAGLRRAVESQSQLVMENLVAAQRLVAAGISSVPDEQEFQHSFRTGWEHPNNAPNTAVPPAAGTGSSAAIAPPLRQAARPREWLEDDTGRSHRAVGLDSARGVVDPRYPLRTHPYDNSSREVYARPTEILSPYGAAGSAVTAADNTSVGRRRRRPSDITAERLLEASSPQRHGATSSLRLTSPQGGRMASEQVPRGTMINAVERRAYDDSRDALFIGGGIRDNGAGGVEDMKNTVVGRHRENSNNSGAPGATGRYYPFVQRHSRPHDDHPIYMSSTTWQDPHGSFNETTSTTAPLPPELARQVPLTAAAAAAAAAAADSGRSRATYDHRGHHGWQRVSGASGDADATGDNIISGHGTEEGEVWDWNGRRLVLQTSRGRRQAGSPATSTAAEQEARDEPKENEQEEKQSAVNLAATSATAMMSAPLLDQIKEVKTAVQALAGAIGTFLPASLAGAETASMMASLAEGTAQDQHSPGSAHGNVSHPHQQGQPTPPAAEPPRSRPSSTLQPSPPSRRASFSPSLSSSSSSQISSPPNVPVAALALNSDNSEDIESPKNAATRLKVAPTDGTSNSSSKISGDYQRKKNDGQVNSVGGPSDGARRMRLQVSTEGEDAGVKSEGREHGTDSTLAMERMSGDDLATGRQGRSSSSTPPRQQPAMLSGSASSTAAAPEQLNSKLASFDNMASPSNEDTSTSAEGPKRLSQVAVNVDTDKIAGAGVTMPSETERDEMNVEDTPPRETTRDGTIGINHSVHSPLAQKPANVGAKDDGRENSTTPMSADSPTPEHRMPTAATAMETVRMSGAESTNTETGKILQHRESRTRRQAI